MADYSRVAPIPTPIIALETRHMRQPPGTPAAYMSGFGNEFATEALPGALPRHRNSPQRVAYGLYA